MTTDPGEQPAQSPDQPAGDEAEPDEAGSKETGPDQRAGRLVAEDEGAHTVTTPNYLARDMGVDRGAAGAEEAAMHVADADVRDTRERDAGTAER